MSETASSHRWQRILAPNAGNMVIWLNACWMLAGIFLLKWNPATIVLAYFLETIVIGLIHIIKMGSILWWGNKQREAPADTSGGLQNGGMLIPFFLVHYFFFVFVQSVFLFSFIEGRDPDIKNSFDVFGNYAVILGRPDVQQAFLAIIVMNIALAIKNFFIPQRYHEYTIGQLFIQPYLRVIIQQFVVLLGGFFFLFSGAGGAAVILILLRLLIDLVLQAAARSKQVKEQVVQKLSAKQTPEDAGRTKEMFNTFLDG